jgi:hypothetical protein
MSLVVESWHYLGMIGRTRTAQGKAKAKIGSKIPLKTLEKLTFTFASMYTTNRLLSFRHSTTL